MSNRPLEERIKALWKDQETETVPMSPEQLQEKAKKFHRQIIRRNIREYVGAAIAIPVFGLYIFIFPPLLIKIGSAMTIAATLYIVWQIHKRLSAGTLPEEAAELTWLEYHKRELEKQRNAKRTVWKWYLAPGLPGFVVITIGVALDMQAQQMPLYATATVLLMLIGVVVTVSGEIWWMNARAASKYQKQIDALDALQNE